MKSSIDTFVSFAGKDTYLTRRVFARLSAQPLKIWDYSAEGEEIPGGERITPFLTKRIDNCELFIPLLTYNYHKSEYTRIEVEHALDLQEKRRLKVIPLVEKDFSFDQSCSPPYIYLRSLRYYEVDFAIKSSLEYAIQRICQDMNLAYVPFISEDQRLPFMDRFQEELGTLVPIHEDRTNNINKRLQKALIDFTSEYEVGDYSSAEKAIDYFISICTYEFPEKHFYYPFVVKAVCLMAMGKWTEVQDLARWLLNHPSCDENVFGILGYVKQQQHCYEEAACYYQKALEIDTGDAAAAGGVLINNRLANKLQPIENLIKILDKGEKLVHEDEIKAERIKAYALASIGRLEEAFEILSNLVEEKAVESGDVINLACVLYDLQREKEAVSVLEQFYERFSDSHELHHRLATIYWHVGRHEDAIDKFGVLIEKAPNNHQYHFDNILCLLKSGRDDQAKTCASNLLNLGLPQTEDDFYRSGFANWVIGLQERAKYDFERSGRPCSDFYNSL